MLVFGYTILREKSIIGKFVDAKAVKEIPNGFVFLEEDNLDNGLHYVAWESQISFLNADGICIYQTGYDNSDFIVKYKKEYYINEKKFLELMDIANALSESKALADP